MKNLIESFLFVILMISCTTSESPNEKIFIDLDASGNLSEDISEEIERIDFFQINNAIPIDKIASLRLMDDQVYFSHRGGRSSSQSLGIVAVDQEGTIVWQYDKKGKGPEEFQYIYNFTILREQKQLVFYDSHARKVKFLDKDGRFVRALDFEQSYNNAGELPNGKMVLNLGKQSVSPGAETSLQYDLVIVDADFKVIEQCLPNHDNGIGMFWFGETMLPGDEDLIYSNTYQNTIFTVNEQGVDSTWKLDFGDYNADTAFYLHPETFDDIINPGSGDDQVLGFRVNHSKKSLWVGIPRKDLVLAVINKKNHQLKMYQKPQNGTFNFEGIPVNLFKLSQSGSQFIYSLQALEALDYWDQLSESERANANPKWKKLIKNLDPESNPIICTLYPK